MTSVMFLCKANTVLLLVVVAQLALLQHATRVEAGTLNHLDYVAKKGQTKADKRGAKTPTVKKELDPDEEVAAVELEALDDEDDNRTTSRPAQKSRSMVGAWWITTRWPRSRAASLKAKVEKGADEELEEDNEDNVVDPLDHEGKSKGKKGASRSDLNRFDVEEKEEGQAPMVVLKIHPVDSRKTSGHPGSSKPTLSPSIDKLVQDNKGKTGPNGTVVITIKPDLSMIAKLNQTGEIEGFGTTTMKKNATSGSIETSTSSTISSSSSFEITQDGSVVKTDAGTTTRIPTFKLSTTPKPGASISIITDSLPGESTSKTTTTGKPTTIRPTTTKRPENKLPTTKSPSPVDCPCMTAKPKTTAKSTTAKPTSKPGSTIKPTTKPPSPATTKKPASSVKPNVVTPPIAKVESPGGCTARPDCLCKYQELKDTDKMLAVVITNRGGFKGRRLNSKAIGQIMAGKLDLQQMLDIQAQKSITVNSNNTYVLPAGHYYFPHPIRFAGFMSP